MKKEKELGDSVIAQELYYALQKEGLKVFFAKITLENKIGESYEPYIYAALNSAKVMLVIGTKKEYFEAPWVKNEWSRYQTLIKNGEEKTIIPCYKEMDAYDLPEEFAYLQAQDMSKIGFEQDLIHGIKKLINKEPTKKKTVKPVNFVIAILAIIVVVMSFILINNMPSKKQEESKSEIAIIRQDVKARSGYTFNVTAEELKNQLLKKINEAGIQGMEAVTLSQPEANDFIAIGWIHECYDDCSSLDYTEDGTAVDIIGVKIYSDGNENYVTGISCVPTKYGSGEVELLTIPVNLYEEAKRILGCETDKWKELVETGKITEATYNTSTGEEITDGSFWAGMIKCLNI